MKRSGLKRNKPLKRTGFLRRTGRLPPVSEKRKDVADELDAVTAALLQRSMGRCEICWDAPAWHRHHRLRQSQGGDNSLENLLHLCWNCHEFVHRYPALSYEQGWLLRSGAFSVDMASDEE